MSFTLPNIVTAITRNLNTKADLTRVQNFIDKHPDLGVTTASFKQAIENINSNIGWMKASSEKIEKFLQNVEKPQGLF